MQYDQIKRASRTGNLRRIQITEVNLAQNYISGQDRYGKLFRVSFSFQEPGIITIPQVGETWTIRQYQQEWYLEDKQLDAYSTITGLSPGDKYIDANTLHLNANLELSSSALASIDITKIGGYPNNANEVLYGNGAFGALPAAPAPLVSNTLSARPAASGNANVMYFATDQQVLYYSNGTQWNRMGLPAGATTLWFSNTAPAGWVIYDGSSLPGSTGIYADLYAHLGNSLTLPNTRGRMPVGLGTHVDVSTIGNNEGIATDANRRPKHQTSSSLGLNDPGHAHFYYQPAAGGAISNINGTNPGAVGSTTGSSTTGITLTGAVGTNNANDALDTSPYLVFAFIAKL